MTAFYRCLLLLAIALVCTARAYAQTTIRGRVLDGEGKPVPNIVVVLGAITDSLGTDVDHDTTRADGRFDVRLNSVDPKTLYVVAVTYEGQLYMGDVLRAPFPLDQEYVVRVGVNPIDLSDMVESATQSQSPEDKRAGAIVIAVATLIIGSLIFVALRRRPPARRRLLVELARLEEDLAAEASNPVLQKRRRELRDRLTTPPKS